MLPPLLKGRVISHLDLRYCRCLARFHHFIRRGAFLSVRFGFGKRDFFFLGGDMRQSEIGRRLEVSSSFSIRSRLRRTRASTKRQTTGLSNPISTLVSISNRVRQGCVGTMQPESKFLSYLRERPLRVPQCGLAGRKRNGTAALPTDPRRHRTALDFGVDRRFDLCYTRSLHPQH